MAETDYDVGQKQVNRDENRSGHPEGNHQRIIHRLPI
jgi:hypothetical protein